MLRARLTTMSVLALGSLVLASCAAGSHAQDSTQDAGVPAVAGRPLAAGVGLLEPAGADLDALVAGISQFGADLHTQVSEPGENVVLSPASIALAFGMARAGAAGTTAEQIDDVLGFPGDETITHASFNQLARELAAAAPTDMPPADAEADGDAGGGTDTEDNGDAEAPRAGRDESPPALAIANALFPDVDATIKDEFLTTLGEQYGAGVIPVDFSRSDGAKEIIDSWVREQTRDRIEKLFDDLDPTTQLVLANAVYLKADWATPFAELPTKDLPFTLADGSGVQVPTMRQLESLRHAAGDGWAAVELPYQGDRLVMRVIVPSGDVAPAALLHPDVLDDIDGKLAEGFVDLHLPRWDFATDLPLIPELEALGMTEPFDPDTADFSGINDRGLYLYDAIHRANITVEEWGTEAAAATGIAARQVSGDIPRPDAVVHADRPFAFVVLDEPTGIPLFIGQVADPRSPGR